MKFRYCALCISSFLPALVASAALSAKSYIADGLIAHWDGIENVSYGGAHNNDATTWTELRGNGPNITNPTGSAFVSDGLQTVRANGTQVAAANAKKILDAFASANYTAEIAFKKTTETPSSSVGYKNKLCTMLLFGNAKYWMGTHEDTKMGMNPNNGGNEGYLHLGGMYVNTPTTMGNHFLSCSQSNALCSARADGILESSTTTTPAAAPSTAHGFCLNRAYYQDYGLDGIYYAIRFYDRPLSADEVAVNYAVDSVRYFGADASSLTLPDGWRFDTSDGVKLEKRLSISVKSGVGGMVSVNGGAAATDNAVWCEQGGTVAVALVATPAEGYVFVGWNGLDDTIKYNASVAASIDDGVYAVFRKADGSEPVSFSWVGAAGGDWNNATSWSDEDGLRGIPVAGDSVTIPAGKSAMMSNSSPRFASVTVEGTLVMTNWTTCLNADAVTINNGGILTCGAAATNKAEMSRVWIDCADLTIAQGGKIDVGGKGYLGLPETPGYANGYGPGVAPHVHNRGTSHGGYGSQKVIADYGQYGSALPYDDPAAPVEPGSSGVKSTWGRGGSGGGCVLVTASGAVTVNGSMLASGESSTSSGNTPDHDTAGSGGSVYITCGTIAGNGTIRADGGNGDSPAGSYPGMVAAGGCIAIHYDTSAQTAAAVAGMTVSADAGHWRGSNGRTTCVNADKNRYEADVGTLHFSDEKILDALLGNGLCGQIRGIASYSRAGDLNFTYGHVRFAEEGTVVSIGGALTMGGTASRLEIGGTHATNVTTRFVDLRSFGASPRLTVGGDLTLGGASRLDVRAAATNTTDLYGAYVSVGGTMTIGTNCFVYSWSDTETPSAPYFEVGGLNVATGGTFSAAWRGGRCGLRTEKDIACYREGGSRMSARGAGSGTAGAGHGGRGGLGTDTSSKGGRTYDDEKRPWLPGSGAGAWDTSSVGGYGGGAILVSATNGTIRIDGEVNADGCDGNKFCNGLGGGGSGGTIFFESRYFEAGETAELSAKGGDTTPSSAATSMGAGGGGRIAIWCGEPYEEGLRGPRLSKGTTPLSGEGDEEFFSFEGTYSVAGGVPVGTYAESWADGASGGAGTVWFARVKERGGLCVIIK